MDLKYMISQQGWMKNSTAMDTMFPEKLLHGRVAENHTDLSHLGGFHQGCTS